MNTLAGEYTGWRDVKRRDTWAEGKPAKSKLAASELDLRVSACIGSKRKLDGAFAWSGRRSAHRSLSIITGNGRRLTRVVLAFTALEISRSLQPPSLSLILPIRCDSP